MNEKWNNRFINLALQISSWSKDYKKVGCIIVDRDTKKVLSTGFNGMPPYYRDSTLYCLSSEDRGRMIHHAEENCLDLLGEEHYNKNLIMYITKPPCKWCAQLIINSKINIKDIYYIKNINKEFDIKYDINTSINLLRNANINIQEIIYNAENIFEIIISQHFNNVNYDHEITIDIINEFIFYTKELINNLDIYLKNNEQTSYIDSINFIINMYGYKNLLEFSKETNSSNPELFIQWLNTSGINYVQ